MGDRLSALVLSQYEKVDFDMSGQVTDEVFS